MDGGRLLNKIHDCHTKETEGKKIDLYPHLIRRANLEWALGRIEKKCLQEHHRRIDGLYPEKLLRKVLEDEIWNGRAI